MAGQKIGDAFIQISGQFDKLNKGLKQTTSKIDKGFSGVTKKLNSQFTALGATFAGAFAADKIIQFTAEAVKLAGVAEGVERAFKRLDNPMLLNNLKEATRGTVSELDLMKQAVQAKNLGVPIKNLASLFEFATQRAADTGEAVDYLVQSIVTGIGRKSPLILDNLGISAIDLKAQLNGVGLEAASVGDIAEAVGKIASKSMKDIGDQALTSAQKMAQMQANIADAQTEFGKNAMPLFLAGLKGINVVLENINDVFGSDKSFFERLKGLASQINPIMLAMKLFGNEAKTTSDKISQTSQSVKTLTDSAAESARTFDFVSGTWSEAWAEFKVGAEKAAAGADTFTESLDRSLGIMDGKVFDFISGQWVQVIKQGTEEVEELSKAFDQAAYNAAYLASVLDRDLSIGGGDTSGISDVPEFDEEAEYEDYDANLKKLAASQSALNEQIAFGSSVAMGFGFALTDSLTSALDGAGNFFEMMGQWIEDLIKKLISAAAAALILSAIFPGLGSFGALFGQFSGFGGGGATSFPFELGGKVRGNDIFIANQRTGNTRGRIGG